MIRKFLICSTAVLLISSAFGQVETWKFDPAHTAAQFAVRHLGISTVRGEFRKASGTATMPLPIPAKPRWM